MFFKQDEPAEQVLRIFAESGIEFPCIAKPDIGGKGRGVEKIFSNDDLVAYTRKINMDFLVQEFVTHTKEVGIFYIRMPDEPKGFVSGIVAKEFLIVFCLKTDQFNIFKRF